MTWCATSGGRSPSLPHLMIESEVRRRRFSFSSNSSNLQTSYTSTPVKGGHPGRRSTFPHLFGNPGTVSSLPHHADPSSSFTDGNHYGEPLFSQYSPAEAADDSGYYGTFESPSRKNPTSFERLGHAQNTWESLASPFLEIRTRLAGRQSYLDTSPNKGLFGKVTPQQVLSLLVIIGLTTIFSLFVLFSLTDVVGEKDELTGLNNELGELSLDYPDDPQFRGSDYVIPEDGLVGMESDSPEDGLVGMESDSEERKGNANIENLNLILEYNKDQANELKGKRDLSEEIIAKPTVVGDVHISIEREEILGNHILEKRKMLDERKKKMWEKNDLLRAKLMEERKERMTDERNKKKFEKEL